MAAGINPGDAPDALGEAGALANSAVPMKSALRPEFPASAAQRAYRDSAAR